MEPGYKQTSIAYQLTHHLCGVQRYPSVASERRPTNSKLIDRRTILHRFVSTTIPRILGTYCKVTRSFWTMADSQAGLTGLGCQIDT